MCMYCKSTETLETVTTHVVNCNSNLIIVKNVPCIECARCGETFYTDEVAATLEKIVNQAKKFLQEVSIIDYQKAA